MPSFFIWCVDVTRAKSDSDRLKKLVLAAKVFTHFDKSRHDSDIQAGAVSVLCSLLRSCSPLFIAKSKEVYWICKILHQLYSRCNEDSAKVSFCVDGSTLIINALEVIEINYRLGKKGDTKCLVVAQNLIDKLLSLACVPLVLIKRHEELMSSLVSNIHGATGRIVMLLVSFDRLSTLRYCLRCTHCLFNSEHEMSFDFVTTQRQQASTLVPSRPRKICRDRL